jgi:putative membrane protein
MSVRHILSVAAAALALAALTACSGTQTPAPAPPGAAPGAGQPGTAPGAGQLGTAHQNAAALAALAALGKEKGGAQVRTLAEQIGDEALRLDEQIRAVAASSGVTLDESASADQQALLADLNARSGASFDQAWTRAVLDLYAKLKTDAEAVLNSPTAAEEAKAAARAALADLDAAMTQLQAGEPGAAPPTGVDTGTGGQAQDGLPVLPVALLAAGALLVGGAVRVARR